MAISEDASTPAVVHGTHGTGTTVTSASFTPPSSTLLVAIANIGWDVVPSGTPTLSISDSVSGSWTVGPASYSSGVGVQCKIFYRYLSSAPGSMTVTATSSDATSKSMQLGVRVVLGANSSQTGAGTLTNSNAGNDMAFTTTAANSWVYVATGRGVNGALTADANTTTINGWDDTNSGDNLEIGRQTAATVTAGPLTLGWTGGDTSGDPFVGQEILIAATTGLIARSLYIMGSSENTQSMTRGMRY